MLENKTIKESFINSIHDKRNITGFTHNFYNYPARFSPIFVREAIKVFSQPGDLIIDPFVGGGTTLVEAKVLDRHSVGLDISSLATFIAKTKVTPLSIRDIQTIVNWTTKIIENLDCNFSLEIQSFWKEKGYHRNISAKATWRIRNMIEHFIYEIENSRLLKRQQNFLRCSILKTGQWALDNKKILPSVFDFRMKLSENIKEMCKGVMEFSSSLNVIYKNVKTICINKPSNEIDKLKFLKNFKSPSLILTSPPYPGVHIVYHRWQVQGKKETPAPFWIANSLDGHGLTHYIMGDRKQRNLENYFANILATFSSVKKVCSNDTLLIQMLAFSDISWQLPKYLEVMNLAGFKEVHFTNDRIWRNVPNRKWYADNRGKTDSSNEVVLFHKLIG